MYKKGTCKIFNIQIKNRTMNNLLDRRKSCISAFNLTKTKLRNETETVELSIMGEMFDVKKLKRVCIRTHKFIF